ncbi:fructose-1,6-bisphosphatase, chloroplastic-like isoform X1 [Arachis hypogaea]|uniref:fructose-1,6-bisphosphatase, chloroplastic-like isoform X1 n=1 Tax=Arachis hypogaea TaxID=3818 RepID=UPI0034E7D15D
MDGVWVFMCVLTKGSSVSGDTPPNHLDYRCKLLLLFWQIPDFACSPNPENEHEPTLEDVLQPGKNMLAAGYCMYSSSCTLVLLLIIGPGMGTSCHGRN